MGLFGGAAWREDLTITWEIFNRHLETWLASFPSDLLCSHVRVCHPLTCELTSEVLL
jgi:hypothetical protein